MANEKGNFRSSLFGGFNRRDVADYIEKLSAERNRYKAENSSLNETVEKLQSDIEDLNAQIKELSDKLEATRREPLGLHIAACEDAIAAASCTIVHVKPCPKEVVASSIVPMVFSSYGESEFNHESKQS